MITYDLRDKTALITGASSGLGERFASTLSKAGARVILASRSKDKLERMANSLGNALPLEMDVSQKESVKSAFKNLEDQRERIDICINNAGWGKLTPIFEEDPDQDFETIMQLNVMGVWYATKAVANHMKNHNIPGSIINIASVNGANSTRAKLTAYCTSKAAVIQMTKVLVGELSPENIRINCIIPGLFHTPLTNYKLDTPEKKQIMSENIPLGFVSDPEGLDGAILLLSSNESSRYMTGACITVDGGKSWGGQPEW